MDGIERGELLLQQGIQRRRHQRAPARSASTLCTAAVSVASSAGVTMKGGIRYSTLPKGRSLDAEYRAYMKKVPYRFIPGVI